MKNDEGAVMNNLKVWPHLAIVALVCAVAAGVGVGWWMKHEQTASAEALPNAARIQRVEGEVALNNGDTANAQSEQWIAATENQPFSVGDRIYTRDNSRASLAFTGRNFARLNPNTSLDVLALNDARTQLALRDGSAVFDVGYLNSGDLFEVATPYGAVDFQQPGLYNVGIDNGQVLVSVLSGLAQVVGMGGSGQISKGELLTLVGSTAADAVLSQLNGRDAGYLVDDYYANQYPRYYDGRYRDYNAYLSDPYYFDPYRRNVSYQYANSYIPGLYDLDYYGDWQNVNGYGNCWAPRVDAGWSPYQTGYWYNDYPYGPTWVSTEPWGYAPYHYGRWASVNDRWYWVPDSTSVTPVYSPALVSFIPFAQNQIGWVPLAPGDVYVPHYYNTSWQPYYFTRDDLYRRTANLNVPGAVTVVSIDDFTRSNFDWRRARRADRNALASVNPVLDPLLVTPLRNAVVNSAWGRGKIDIPPGIARKLRDTTVVTSTTPASPPFRPDFAKSMRVNQAPDRAKGQKFQMRDERQAQNQGQGRGGPPPQAAQQRVEQPRVAEQPRPVEQPRRAEQPQRVEQPRVAEQPRRVQQPPQRQQQQRVERAPRAARAERPVRPAQQQQPRGERVAAPARPQPQPRAQPQPRRVEVPRPQPQVRREQAPVRTQPAPRAQPQPRPAAPAPRAQPQQQKPQKPERPAGGQPSPGGGKGKGKKP
jgi:hypothetical protein